jgi:hypothetical protein
MFFVGAGVFLLSVVRSIFGDYSKPFNRIKLNNSEKFTIYFLLNTLTLIVLLYATNFSNIFRTNLGLGVFFAFLLIGFFIINFFESALNNINHSKLSRLFFEGNIYVFLFLTMFVKFLVLYYLNETILYVTDMFFVFLINYSSLMIFLGLVIGFRKQRELLSLNTQMLVIVLDPIVIVFIVELLFLLTYKIILLSL